MLLVDDTQATGAQRASSGRRSLAICRSLRLDAELPCYALAFRRAQQTEGRHDFIQKGCLLTITTALKRREPTARCH
jgi:hypothetical protein